MVDPGFVPELIGWGVGKSLDRVIKYVAEASKCFDHCQELQTLLLDIKPSVERAIEYLNCASSSSTSHLPIGVAAAWLRELKLQLETVEDQLQKALNWLAEKKERSPVPFDIITRHKWSRSILKITEGIRKLAQDRAPFVNLESTLYTSKVVEDLTGFFYRNFSVDRRSQLMEVQMEAAELRLTNLVHTELCKIGGDEAIVNEVKGVLEAGIQSEIQKLKRWQEKPIQNPQEQSNFREESITQDEPEVDGSSYFTARFQRILSGLTNDQQAHSQEEPGLMNDQQATSQEEYHVGGSTNLTNCLESTSESSAMEDQSTRQASVKEIITPYRYSLHDLNEATNNFAKENEVGSGGFGAVFRGRLENGELIAVKRFRGFYTQIFLNELEIHAQLGHQNIVRLYGYSNDEKPKGVKKVRHMFKTRKEGRLLRKDSTEYLLRALVFEYMENGDLNNMLHGDNCRLDWPIRFNIVLGIARGLVYLHHDGPRCIVHCDIKTSNILLDAHFRPKIADFGSSFIFPCDKLPHLSGVVAQTMGYFDPSEAAAFDASSIVDVYSFGVVLLEIVSGRRPYIKSVHGSFRNDIFLSELAIRLFKRGGVEVVVKELLDPKLMNETPSASQVHKELLISSYIGKL